MTAPFHCYDCNGTPVEYMVNLDYDFTPEIRLCAKCAAWERDWGSVVWIRSLRPEERMVKV